MYDDLGFDMAPDVDDSMPTTTTAELSKTTSAKPQSNVKTQPEDVISDLAEFNRQRLLAMKHSNSSNNKKAPRSLDDAELDPELLAEAKRQKMMLKAARSSSMGTLSTATATTGGTFTPHSDLHIQTQVLRGFITSTRVVPRVTATLLPTARTHMFENAHERGVQCLRWLHPDGHPMLLSGGADGKVVLYNILRRQKIMTYHAHSKGLRDVAVLPGAASHQMITSGYDRGLLLWDMETGSVVRSLDTDGAVAMCLGTFPQQHADHAHSFLSGLSTNNIRRWDLRDPGTSPSSPDNNNNSGGSMVYKGHIASVNSLVFVEGARRFVTCADDMTLKMWDVETPTLVKNVVDPNMSSIMCLRSHPLHSSTFLAHASDGQVLVYSFKAGRLRLETPVNAYKGHILAGHATEANFSPDGSLVSCGDGSGKMWMWNTKTKQIVKKFVAHNLPLVAHTWFPGSASLLVTGAWDGHIKIWEKI